MASSSSVRTRVEVRRLATAGVLAAAVMYGTTGTAQAIADAGGSTYAVGAGRTLIGATALLLIVMLAGSARAVPAVVRTPAWPFAVLGMASYQACFFAGVDRTGVAVGTLVGIGSGPLFTGLLATAVDRTPPSAAWLRATGVALVGLTLLTLAGTSDGEVDGLGIVLMLAAGFSYAVTTIAQRRLIGVAGHDPVTVMAAIFGGAAIVLLPVLLLTGPGWIITPRGAALVLYLGLVPTALAYILVGRALRTLQPATVASLNLAEPVTAALLGVAVLSERLSPAGLLGCALVLAGLALVGRAATRPAGRDYHHD